MTEGKEPRAQKDRLARTKQVPQMGEDEIAELEFLAGRVERGDGEDKGKARRIRSPAPKSGIRLK